MFIPQVLQQLQIMLLNKVCHLNVISNMRKSELTILNANIRLPLICFVNLKSKVFCWPGITKAIDLANFGKIFSNSKYWLAVNRLKTEHWYCNKAQQIFRKLPVQLAYIPQHVCYSTRLDFLTWSFPSKSRRWYINSDIWIGITSLIVYLITLGLIATHFSGAINLWYSCVL